MTIVLDKGIYHLEQHVVGGLVVNSGAQIDTDTNLDRPGTVIAYGVNLCFSTNTRELMVKIRQTNGAIINQSFLTVFRITLQNFDGAVNETNATWQAWLLVRDS